MIQRIQTVYLLLAALFSAAPLLFPFAAGTGAEGIFADGYFGPDDHIALQICVYIAIADCAGSIFMYSNRRIQLLVSRLAGLVNLGVLGGIAYGLLTTEVAYSMGIGLFTPMAAIILLFFAQRGIQADERLVRSMDRIR